MRGTWGTHFLCLVKCEKDNRRSFDSGRLGDLRSG